MTDLTPNHPAVKAGCQAAGEWAEDASVDAPDHIARALHMTATCITAALPHLTADDLRNTPAGRKLMAEGWDALIESMSASGEFHDVDLRTMQRLNPYRGGDA